MHKSQSPCTLQYKRPYRNEHTLLIWRYFQGCVNNIGDKIPRYIATYYFWLKCKCCRDHNIDITLPVRYSLDSIKTGITIFSLRHKDLLIPCYSLCLYSCRFHTGCSCPAHHWLSPGSSSNCHRQEIQYLADAKMTILQYTYLLLSYQFH